MKKDNFRLVLKGHDGNVTVRLINNGNVYFLIEAIAEVATKIAVKTGITKQELNNIITKRYEDTMLSKAK